MKNVQHHKPSEKCKSKPALTFSLPLVLISVNEKTNNKNEYGWMDLRGPLYTTVIYMEVSSKGDRGRRKMTQLLLLGAYTSQHITETYAH